jgi:prepilin-type N-terminal cleavage/methylation domain-containing protein
MCKRSGFTLIELLVVIAIVALLMAILMPALQRVKKQAQAVACMSNIKQWSYCWHMYLEDSGGKFPSGAPYVRQQQNLILMGARSPLVPGDGQMKEEAGRTLRVSRVMITAAMEWMNGSVTENMKTVGELESKKRQAAYQCFLTV